jgi:ABC-2 type transport system permease protein
MKWHRVWAVVLRHLYNFRRNLDRVVDSFYWPSLDIVVWGLTISAMQQQGQTPLNQVLIILVATILWFIMWRGQGEITVNFLEELWSENLTNLFASPLRLVEWMTALCIIGVMK